MMVPPPNLLVVAVDDKTFADTGYHWPFQRRRHAQAIDRLRRAGARVIVYDVQFTEQTTARDDNALITAVDKADNVVLATAETDEKGGSNVLGGDEFLHEHRRRGGREQPPRGPRRRAPARRVRRTAACRRWPRSSPGARAAPTKASSFEKDGAWIDFHGPPGTIDTVSFSDLLAGQGRPRARARARRGRRARRRRRCRTCTRRRRATSSMSGPEIEANAIDTVLRGMPLHGTPRWAGLLIVLALGFLPALVSLRLRPLVAVAVVPAIAFVFLFIAQRAFDHGRILPVAMPLFALALGTVSTIGAGYAAERRQRFRVTRRNVELEEAVRERTVELRETQLEVIHRLPRPPSRATRRPGMHLERISRMCERLGLALGMTATEAETLRNASLLHDVGKIGVPDAILLQPGSLSPEDRELMRRHTTVGSELLSGSSSDVMRMAEEIARTHHERWDGGGYPAGLAGEQIPLVGRICAVCDVFDALLSDRPYKEPWPVPEALDAAAQRARQALRPGRGRRLPGASSATSIPPCWA